MIPFFSSKSIIDYPTEYKTVGGRIDFRLLSLLRIGGSTAILDALYEAIDKLNHVKFDDKIIIIFSDGKENASKDWKDIEYIKNKDAFKEHIIEKANKYNIIIHSIDVGKETKKGYLESFAIGTGGKYKHIYKASDFLNTYKELYKIHTIENSKYIVKYTPRKDSRGFIIKIKLINREISNEILIELPPGYDPPTTENIQEAVKLIDPFVIELENIKKNVTALEHLGLKGKVWKLIQEEYEAENLHGDTIEGDSTGTQIENFTYIFDSIGNIDTAKFYKPDGTEYIIMNFNYNENDDKIISINCNYNGNSLYNIKYEYDKDDNRIKKNYIDVDGFDSIIYEYSNNKKMKETRYNNGNMEEYFDYSYAPGDKDIKEIETKKCYNSNSIFQYRIIYRYGIKGINTIETCSDTLKGEIENGIEYIYDQNGNKIEEDHIIIGEYGKPIYKYKYKTFDDDNNWKKRITIKNNKLHRVTIRKIIPFQ